MSGIPGTPAPRDPEITPAPPSLASRLGGLLFLLGAAVTAGAILLPHPLDVDTGGFWALFVLQLALTALMFGSVRLSDAAARRIASLVTFGAILAVSLAVYLNGDRVGGATVLGSFYVWPALYAAYFFGRAMIAGVIAAVAIGYCLASILGGVEVATLAIRALVVVAVVAGSAFAAGAVRLHIDSLLKRLDRLARIDSLTALTNRRGFDQQLVQISLGAIAPASPSPWRWVTSIASRR